MLFAGTLGVFAQDNTNLFWDDSNNRLGIGTVSPQQRLHLSGAGTTALNIENTSAGTGVSLRADGNGLSMGSIDAPAQFVISPFAPTSAYVIGFNGQNTASSFYTLGFTANFPLDVMIYDVNVSDAVAAGFGGRVHFKAMSTTDAHRDVALMEYVWATATDASRAGRGLLYAYYTTTERECLRWEADATAPMIGFLGGGAVVKQTSGANLTNNVTSGGTDDTIDNWTDLTTYATDAAAIRNAVYQLARKVKQLNDGLRNFSLFT